MAADVGHVPEELDRGEASDAGQRSIEHLRDTPVQCFESTATELGKELDLVGLSASEIDERVSECESVDWASLFASYVRNETWQVPTLVVARARLPARPTAPATARGP